MIAKPKRKKCRQCQSLFTPRNSFHKLCVTRCAIEYVKASSVENKRGDVQRALNREYKAAKRVSREESLSWWTNVDSESASNGGNTAHWLHRWIRDVRDREWGCIMCGKTEPGLGGWNACHYRSRGAAKHLRFTPDNIWKGCHTCNTHTSGDTGAKYRANLVLRIGEERVLELDNDNTIHRWTIDECREIRDFYKAQIKELE